MVLHLDTEHEWRYLFFMDANRTIKITNLEVQIALLEVEERRLQGLLLSTLSSPNDRSEAQTQLKQTRGKINEALDEIVRLELEQ